MLSQQKQVLVCGQFPLTCSRRRLKVVQDWLPYDFCAGEEGEEVLVQAHEREQKNAVHPNRLGQMGGRG